MGGLGAGRGRGWGRPGEGKELRARVGAQSRGGTGSAGRRLRAEGLAERLGAQ